MKFIVNLKMPFSPLLHQSPAGNMPEDRKNARQRGRILNFLPHGGKYSIHALPYDVRDFRQLSYLPYEICIHVSFIYMYH